MTVTEHATNGHDTKGPATLTRPDQTQTRPTATLVLPAETVTQLQDYLGWYYPGQPDYPLKAIAEEMIAIAHARAEKDNRRAETKDERAKRLAS